MMGGISRLKHVERLTEINKLRNVAPCWLYCANILAMHGPMNVIFTQKYYNLRTLRPGGRNVTPPPFEG